MAGRLRRSGLDGLDLLIVGAAALALALFLVAEGRIAGVAGLPLDDGWIHLRLASNFAAGHGFGINPGEPVAASTAPLWTLGLAGLLTLGLPGLAATKGLGVACYVATGLITRRLAAAVGLGPGLALGAGLAVVGLGRLVWGALSGMEVPLAAGLVALAAWAVVRDRPLVGAMLLGLATLARPEAGLLVALQALSARSVGDGLRRLGLAALVVSPQVLFSLKTVGRMVPTSAAAKVTGGAVGQVEGFGAAWGQTPTVAAAYLREWVTVLQADHPALPVLGFVGLVVLRGRPLHWLAMALVLHPLAVAVVAPYQGPGFQTGRYSAHLLPLAVVVGSAGLARLLAWVPGRVLRAAVLGLLLLALAWRLPGAADAYAWGVQNINAMQVELGRWLAARTPRDALVALNDLGALTYFGDRRAIDLVGLGTPEVLTYRRQGPAGLLRYVEARCPAYLVIFPAWFPDLAARRDLFVPMTAITLTRNVVSGAATMVVYRSIWAPDAPGGAAPCLGRR